MWVFGVGEEWVALPWEIDIDVGMWCGGIIIYDSVAGGGCVV